MSILKTAKRYTKLTAVLLCVVGAGICAWAWEGDLSRRVNAPELKPVEELRWPSSLKSAEELFAEAPMQQIFNSVEPSQPISILQTETGFIPDTIRIRKGANYKIFVANVNEKFKNASFVLDSFGQNHGIYFGQPKNFDLMAKTDGIFTFLCPETGAEGKIIVYSDKELTNPMAASHGDVKK
jgi:hypothetical protein